MTEYPKNCHNCFKEHMVVCRDNGVNRSYHTIEKGKIGDFVSSVVSKTHTPEDYIFCQECNKIVYRLKITRKWIMQY